jgi:peptidoglycan/xylan/chitin deacetylase (PgdA/CDA1 family)
MRLLLPLMLLLLATPCILPAADSVPVVMLKLDDLGRGGSGPEATVSPRWQRLVDFLAAEQVPCNLGILTESLDTSNCPGYVAWLKALDEGGLVEFWNHGYYNSYPKTDPKAKGEYNGRSVEDQTATLLKSQKVMLDKTGITFRAFGPHNTPPDENLHPALANVPELTICWFYGPAKGTSSTTVVLERRCELEKPIFKPNPDYLKEKWPNIKARDYIAVQGHPNSWGDQEFENFKTYVLFLKEQGCRFMKVSDFVKEKGLTPAK